MIELTSGTTRLELDPDHGGAVVALRVGEVDVLRPGRGGDDPLASSGFALLPWCNRIGGARFSFDDRRVELEPTEGHTPHALHGHGWLSAWDASEVGSDKAVLEFEHPADAWPWRYRARQTITVEPGRAEFRLELTNFSDTAMPGAIGWHPYFERPARLSATVDGEWVPGPDLLPERWEERPGFRSADVDGIVVDSTFTGWDGRAIIEHSQGRIEVASDLDLIHIFAPAGKGFFCIEPVGAGPDAPNHPERGMAEIQPGMTLAGWMRIGFSDH